MLGKAMVAIALLAGAACGKQDGGSNAPGSASGVASAAGSGTATASGASGSNVAGSNIAGGSGSVAVADAVASGSGAALASGELPKECQQWKDAVERLAKCDQMPEVARKSLRQAYDTAAAAWSSLPTEDRAHLAGSCLAGANAILESAKLTCGW